MTRLPREPLDADERALAARLPRMHGRDEPDAALDARILAAAHAAVSAVPVTKRRRDWIVPLTAAASVSLAVGLAWQLQPPAGPSIVPASAPVASEIAAGDNDQRFMDSVEAPPPSANVVQARPVPMVSPARQQAIPAGDVARIVSEVAPAEPAAESSDMAAPMFVPPPPPTSMADAMPVVVAAPPPAPPAPVIAQGAMARSAAADAGASATGAVMPAQAKRARNEAEAAADVLTSEQISKAVDEEDVPPATMNAPAARDAWLKRIAELQQQGRIDDAKASLAEFRRRYPEAVLPPELRKLEP